MRQKVSPNWRRASNVKLVSATIALSRRQMISQRRLHKGRHKDCSVLPRDKQFYQHDDVNGATANLHDGQPATGLPLKDEGPIPNRWHKGQIFYSCIGWQVNELKIRTSYALWVWDAHLTYHRRAKLPTSEEEPGWRTQVVPKCKNVISLKGQFTWDVKSSERL